MMEINQLVDTFNNVAGLNENQAKTSIYYSIATHKLNHFDWFPALAFIGPPGTGKSKAIDTLEPLCFKPLRITCHATMTPVALRDDLARARNRTALIEEADLYPNRKQLQSFLINRVDRYRTSGLPIKEQVETDTGVKEWRTRYRYISGATIIHDRHSLDDMAAESRVITINTVFKEGNYIEPPRGLSLPRVTLGDIPDYFTCTGRALDTWKPLIMVASSLGDSDWLQWACQQIKEATNDLKDGQVYEEKLAVFGQVIRAFCDNSGLGLFVRENEGLVLQNSVVEPLRREFPYINPRTVAKNLTKMGLTVIRHGGTNKLFTSVDELKRVAKEIGYEDEVLKDSSMHSCKAL